MMVGQNHSAREHTWAAEHLSEYLDNRLDARARARIEAHLDACAECRAALQALRWTVALVKHAPTPALPRAFTLPVPPARAARPSLAFGFAQFGAALATLLLLAALGVDVLTQWGGGTSAPMISSAKEFAEPTLAVAGAPQMQARDQLDAPSPTPAAQPTAPRLAPTKAPAPTMAPPAAAPMSKPPMTADAEKARTATAVLRAGFAVTTTATVAPTLPLAPTLTPTPLPPTPTRLVPTRVAQARASPHAPQPAPAPHPAAPLLTPLRVVEVGLLLLALLFGAWVIVLGRRK